MTIVNSESIGMLHGNRLRSNSTPSAVSKPDTFIIPREDFVTLVKVTGSRQFDERCSGASLLLSIPWHLADVLVMVDSMRRLLSALISPTSLLSHLE